jgi:hypothetical protein
VVAVALAADEDGGGGQGTERRTARWYGVYDLAALGGKESQKKRHTSPPAATACCKSSSCGAREDAGRAVSSLWAVRVFFCSCCLLLLVVVLLLLEASVRGPPREKEIMHHAGVGVPDGADTPLGLALARGRGGVCLARRGLVSCAVGSDDDANCQHQRPSLS